MSVRVINCNLQDLTPSEGSLEESLSEQYNAAGTGTSEDDMGRVEVPKDLAEYKDLLVRSLADVQTLHQRSMESHRLEAQSDMLKLGIISDMQALEILHMEARSLNEELAKERADRVERIAELQDELVRQSNITLYWRNQLLAVLRKLYCIQNNEDQNAETSTQEDGKKDNKIVMTFDNISTLEESEAYFEECLRFVTNCINKFGTDTIGKVPLQTVIDLYLKALKSEGPFQNECFMLGKTLISCLSKDNIEATEGKTTNIDEHNQIFDSEQARNAFVMGQMDGIKHSIECEDKVMISVLYELNNCMVRKDEKLLDMMIGEHAVELSLKIFMMDNTLEPSSALSVATSPNGTDKRDFNGRLVSSRPDSATVSRSESAKEGPLIAPPLSGTSGVKHGLFPLGTDQFSVSLSASIVKFLELCSKKVSLADIIVKENFFESFCVINSATIDFVKALTNGSYGAMEATTTINKTMLKKAVYTMETMYRSRKPGTESDYVLNYINYLIADMCSFPKSHTPLSASQSIAILRSDGTVTKGRFLKLMTRPTGTPTFPIDTHAVIEDLDDDYDRFYNLILKKLATNCQEACRRSSTDPDRCFRVINSTPELSASILCIINFIQGKERNQNYEMTKTLMESLSKLITVVYYGCVSEVTRANKESSNCQMMLCDISLLCSLVKSTKAKSDPALLGYVSDMVDCVIPMFASPLAPDDRVIALTEVLLGCADKIIKYASCVNDGIATAYAFLCDTMTVKTNKITPSIRRLLATMLLRLCVDKKKKRLISDSLTLFARDEFGEGIPSELHNELVKEASSL